MGALGTVACGVGVTQPISAGVPMAVDAAAETSAGRPDLSQGAFMGLGAYVSAKVSTDHGFLAGLGSAVVVTFVVALVVGILLGVGSAHFSVLPAVVSNVMAQSGGAVFSAFR